jgi:hypothetical protein
MKTLIKALVSLCFTSALLSAQSGINYQGRLTNSSGAPVTGTKTFSIAIYPSATGGQAIYSESIGSVTLDANGVYGFQFGVNGTSVSAVSLSLGSTVVGQAVYSKVLPEAAIAGSVNVSDGVNTWSQSTGSSSPATFLGSYDSNSRTVTAIYLSQVPSVSRNITVGYSRSTSGLFSALDINQSQWLELTIDSSVQSPRERILAVPYALSSSTANRAQTAGAVDARVVRYIVSQLESPPSSSSSNSWKTLMPIKYFLNSGSFSSSGNGGVYDIPKSTKSIVKVTCATLNQTYLAKDIYNIGVQMSGWCKLSLNSRSVSGVVNVLDEKTATGQVQDIILSGPFELDHSNFEYFLKAEVGASYVSYNNLGNNPSGIELANLSNIVIDLISY